MFVDKLRRRSVRTVPAVFVALAAFTVFSAGCLSLPSPSDISPLAPTPVTRDPLGLTIVHSNDTWGYLEPCG